MHEQGGDGAPPRFRLSGNRWGYPIFAYRQWLERRMQIVEEALGIPPKRRRARDTDLSNPTEAA
jgi:hypothetical protein